MSTRIKIKLFKGKTNADGTHPVQLQFYFDGKHRRKSIYNCLEKDWDEKQCRVKSKVPNAAYINSIITERYIQYERQLLKVVNGESAGSTLFEEKVEVTLDKALEKELARFKAENKPMTHARISGYRKELSLYFNSNKTLIKDINLRWFEKYAAFLTNDLASDGELIRKGNIGSTAQKKIKDVKRIIEKHYSGHLSDDVKKFRISTKKPVKVKLTPAELDKIEQLELPDNSLISICRDIFLLQVYLRGSRIGALLQAYSKQFSQGRYIADNSLTGKNNVGSKLIPKAQAIVDRYIGKHQRLFPLYTFNHNSKLSAYENNRKAFKHKQSCTSMVNNNLKVIAEKCGIKKPLTTHIARHTFARMAIDKINNPMVTMELLGHSSLAVHQAYLNDIRKDDVLDAAADEIFG